MRILAHSKNMRKIAIFSCIVLIITGVVMAVTFLRILQPTNDKDNIDSKKQQEMLEIILKCGDLAPIPKNAEITNIKTEGSMFSRGFRLVFKADMDTINVWMKASKGIGSEKGIEVNGKKKYILNVINDFEYGEIIVDNRNGMVSVYVSKG